LRARCISSLLVEPISGATSTEKPGNSGSQARLMASTGQESAGPASRAYLPRLGASSVPRHDLAPHQQGYSAFSFLV
jgi:hypothetical protein